MQTKQGAIIIKSNCLKTPIITNDVMYGQSKQTSSPRSKNHLAGFLLPALAAMCSLTGCTVVEKNVSDGPPKKFNPANIIEVTPRAEPKTRYGNHSPYQVFGKTYHVMGSSQGYEETGTASWYGAKFHGRRTSSWEPYDLNAMTAAHRSLPLPTYVEVTNLSNKRSIIVKVNDRGPFHQSRIIDLSYAAAYRLGFIHQGTAEVHVKALDFSPQPLPLTIQANTQTLPKHQQPTTVSAITVIQTAPATTRQQAVENSDLSQSQFAVGNQGKTLNAQVDRSGDKGQLFVQAGAFSSLTSAKQLQYKLHSVTSLPVGIFESVTATNPSKTIHRVRIGPVESEMQALMITDVIRAQKIAQPVLVWN